MTRNRKTALAISLASLLCVAAYASATYLLSPAVVDSGGGHAESSNHELDASIGGPVVLTTAAGPKGEAASTNYSLQVNSVSLMDTPAPQGGGGGCAPGDGGAPAGLLLLTVASVCAMSRAGRETARR